MDYKLPENFIFNRFVLPKAKDGSAIPVGDFSGSVVSTTLPNLKPSDRVFGRGDPPNFGALGEFMIAHGNQAVVPIPDGVSLKDASTVGVAGLTAWQCIAPYVEPGSKVLINGGSGGTGTFGIQIAKALGCYVTTTCSGANVQLCKDLGADEVIDYRSVDLITELKTKHSNKDDQFDLLIDNVDTPALYWNSETYLKPEGRFITIAGSINLKSMFSMAQILYLPTWLGGGKRKSQMLLRKSDMGDYTKVAELMKEGKVKAVIDKVYPLEDAGEAMAKLKSGRTKGKIVVQVGGE